MTDVIDAGSAAVEGQAPLKSTDTRVKIEVKPEPVVQAEAPKPEPVSSDNPEGVDDNAPAADSQQQAAKKQRLPRWMQERLDRVREVTEAETRAKVLEEIQKSSPKPEPEKVTQAKAEKTLEDFDYDQDAFLEYKLERKLEQREAKAREEEAKRKATEAKESFHKRVDSFEEKVGDGAWEDILKSPINNDATYSPLVQAVLGGQDVTHADEETLMVLHELATKPDEAKRLLELSPFQRLREVAKLADRFSGQQQERPAPVLPKKTTNAPPPPKTVSGSGKPSVDINAPDLTPEQRIAMWRKKA